MRYLRLALLPLVFAACTEQQPAAPDIEAPPNLGATVTDEIVYLHPLRLTWMDTDPAQGEDWDVVLLGYDPADDIDCNGGVFVGGIPARSHGVVSMEGFPDEFSQRDQQVLTTIGRAPLYLYTRESLPFGGTPDDWCEFWNNDWIASGHWTAHQTDNDVSGFDATPGNNSFGLVEAGVLWGTDGAKYKYSWKYRAHCDPEAGCRTLNGIDRVERIK
jgi:hypothetical protein